jgi:hypothetical protein
MPPSEVPEMEPRANPETGCCTKKRDAMPSVYSGIVRFTYIALLIL